MRVGGGRDDEEVSRKLKSMDVDKLENGGGEEDSPRPPRPAVKYHGWKAMPFIIGNETFEKLGTLGTSANLLVYLTQVFHMRSVDAATLLNGLNGTTSLAPIIGAFLSDAYLGRYLALAIASVASLIMLLGGRSVAVIQTPLVLWAVATAEHEVFWSFQHVLQGLGRWDWERVRQDSCVGLGSTCTPTREHKWAMSP